MTWPTIKDMAFDIVPRDLVEPFKGDKILQVMFLAIFFGLILNKMGDKAKGAVECIDFMFRFAIALQVIVKAIPLMVFLSMASLLASTGLESLVTFSGLFGGLVIGVTVVCADKLGIDAKLAAFSIPVGVQLNKAGNCIFFSLVTLMLMRVYDIDKRNTLPEVALLTAEQEEYRSAGKMARQGRQAIFSSSKTYRNATG